MHWAAVHASQVTQVAAANFHLNIVRHRGKALLLGFKDGNACGLQASLGHADAAVANPILHQQKKLSDAFYACWCKCSFQSALMCVPTTANVDCDPSGGTSECLLGCNRQFANARAGMYDAQLIQPPFLALPACQNSWHMAYLLSLICLPSHNVVDALTGICNLQTSKRRLENL